MLKLSFSENTNLLKKRSSCLKFLREKQVSVGLTSTASARSRFLLAVHTHGSPLMRIQPRPVVQPALQKEDTRAAMAEHMLEACAAALDGDLKGTREGLEKAGRAGADGIRAYIDSRIPPPNAPVTLTGGWIYNRVAKKGVPVKGKNGDVPLKDTGQLYDDFDWEIMGR